MSDPQDRAPIPPQRLAELFSLWRRDPSAPVRCPLCGEPLAVTDRSARPFAEWFNFHCSSCDFDHTFHIPLAGPSSY